MARKGYWGVGRFCELTQHWPQRPRMELSGFRGRLQNMGASRLAGWRGWFGGLREWRTCLNQRREPCRGPAIAGATICRIHGGSAPQVKRAAAMRLAVLIDPPIGLLAEDDERKTTSKIQRTRCGPLLASWIATAVRRPSFQHAGIDGGLYRAGHDGKRTRRTTR